MKSAEDRPIRRKRQRRLTGSIGPGPLQRQVLRVLHGVKLLAEASPERRPTATPNLFLIYIPPVSAELGRRYGKGVTAGEIARILSDVVHGDGRQYHVEKSSVDAALSGMVRCDGRYWVSKHPYDRWSISKNGLAWL